MAMLTNGQMKAGRFAKWAVARRRIAAIQSHLSQGHTIMISTHLRTWECSKRHAGMFKATKSGAYMQSGKSWNCIDGCAIRVFG